MPGGHVGRTGRGSIALAGRSSEGATSTVPDGEGAGTGSGRAAQPNRRERRINNQARVTGHPLRRAGSYGRAD